ncbi:MAG: hypothetical protein ACKVVP_16065 [Chloroflexota bacterium]
MELCQARVGSICTETATWRQSVHAGDRPTGRVMYWTYWCDEHAKRVVERRRTNWLSPATMEPMDGIAAALADSPHTTPETVQAVVAAAQPETKDAK